MIGMLAWRDSPAIPLPLLIRDRSALTHSAGGIGRPPRRLEPRVPAAAPPPLGRSAPGGLNPNNVARAAEDSLRRLRTDRIDLYYAHEDDTGVPLDDALGAFDALVRDGKVGHVGASNYDADRLAEALEVADRATLNPFEVVQPHDNLMERHAYEERGLADVAADHGLACVSDYGLAKGFLTGEYRPDADAVESPRAKGAGAYLDGRGLAVLAALDDIAAAHDAPIPAVALAWLAAQPTVASVVASARSPEQLAGLLPMVTLELSPEELARLDAASE